MKNQSLSRDDAMALTAGSLPADRPDLVALAAAIDDFREARAEPAPQPSPQLMGWLTGAPPLPQDGAATTATAAAPARACISPFQRRIRMAARALAGLSVAAKIALGGTAALAAVASTGAVGALPEGPQAVFDRILNNDHADAPLPRTPSDQTAQSDTGPASRSDARSDARSDPGSGSDEQLHMEQRSPNPSVPEPQRGGSTESPHNTTDRPPRSGGGPASHTDETDDSDDEGHEDSDAESGDEPDNDADDEFDGEPDDGPDDQRDDESDDQSDHEHDRSQTDDTDETEEPGDAAADVHDSSNSTDNAAGVDAETEEAD
jgi:hypothetical protein